MPSIFAAAGTSLRRWSADAAAWRNFFGNPCPTRRKLHHDIRTLPHALDARDMTQNFEAGLCLPASTSRSGIEAGLAGSRSPAIRSRAFLAGGRASVHARLLVGARSFVVEQSTNKRRCDFARRLRQRLQALGIDARSRDQMRAAAIDADRGKRSTVIRICTSTAERSLLSSTRISPASAGRKAFASGLLEVNTKPSPASAFTRITGSPRAASDPITAGCNAT